MENLKVRILNIIKNFNSFCVDKFFIFLSFNYFFASYFLQLFTLSRYHENSQLISSHRKLFLPLFIFNFQLITHPYRRLIATHEANKDCEKVHLTRAQKILKEI